MIDLTSWKCNAAAPALMTAASIMDPAFGVGVMQRIARLGDRFAIDYGTPAMEIEAEGRRAIALLQRAQREGARVRYPQPGLRVRAVGTPLVSGAHTGGTTLALKGLSAKYGIRQGQALNLIVGGRYYLHFAAEPAVMDASGAGSVLLTTPMRKHLAGDESIEIARPLIEGWLDGNKRSWTLDLVQTVGLSFTVTEKA